MWDSAAETRRIIARAAWVRQDQQTAPGHIHCIYVSLSDTTLWALLMAPYFILSQSASGLLLYRFAGRRAH
jgi:hypothetical protein